MREPGSPPLAPLERPEGEPLAHPSIGPRPAMLREWESGGQTAGPQRVRDLRAPERKALGNGVLSAGECVKEQDPLCCRGDRDSAAPLG